MGNYAAKIKRERPMHHHELSGLEDDDHTQYLTSIRHDTPTRHPLGNLDPNVCSEAEADAKINTHKGQASAHHAKFTIAEHDTPTRHPVSVIKTSQGSVSGSVGAMSTVDIIMNVKSLFPSMGGDTGLYIVTRHITVQYTSQFRLWNENPDTAHYYIGWYYLS